MKKKGYTAEQIIGKLREAEVLLSQGSTVKLPFRSQTDNSCQVGSPFLADNTS
jgi:hypothetical protein